MPDYRHIEFDALTVTREELDWHIRSLHSVKRRRFPPSEPVPTPPVEPPATGTVIFEATNWLTDFPASWSATCSPETAKGSNVSDYASVKPISPDTLAFEVVKPPPPETQAGARALYDPRQKRTWDGLSAYYDRTVEFVNTWHFPAEIPKYSDEGGFMQWAWQFKADASPGANASMAVCLHTFKGEGMRPYLTTNQWADRAEDATFPLLPVGADFETRLLVHFHSDPAKGWMEFHYAGRMLRVTGFNMMPNGGVGAYMDLYGSVGGVLLCKRCVMTALD